MISTVVFRDLRVGTYSESECIVSILLEELRYALHTYAEKNCVMR